MSSKFPLLICTSIVRASQKGDRHGGVYMVDFNKDAYTKLYDWGKQNIDWAGRGAERGIRGIAFYKDQIIIVSSSEVLFFDQNFKIIETYDNQYLKYAHEICVKDDYLYISSTGSDSIIRFDLNNKIFDKALCIRFRNFGRIINRLSLRYFWLLKLRMCAYGYNPQDAHAGPDLNDTWHLNCVSLTENNKLSFSGTGLSYALETSLDLDDQPKIWQRIPMGTHNVNQYNGGVVYNDTANDRTCYVDKQQITHHYQVTKYDAADLKTNNNEERLARQGFARGLAFWDDWIFIGSSPMTITAVNIATTQRKVVQLSKEIEQTVHGLEIFPYKKMPTK